MPNKLFHSQNIPLDRAPLLPNISTTVAACAGDYPPRSSLAKRQFVVVVRHSNVTETCPQNLSPHININNNSSQLSLHNNTHPLFLAWVSESDVVLVVVVIAFSEPCGIICARAPINTPVHRPTHNISWEAFSEWTAPRRTKSSVPRSPKLQL